MKRFLGFFRNKKGKEGEVRQVEMMQIPAGASYAGQPQKFKYCLHAIGGRPQQEDSDVVAELSAGLNEEMATRLLNSAFLEAEKGVKALVDEQKNRLSLRCGSTATVSLQFLDKEDDKRKLAVANLGDSRTYLYVRKKDNTTELKLLTEDHKPNSESESKRITENRGSVVNGRLGGSLAVSRAFGDNNLERFGISHEPEIKITTLDDDVKFAAVLNICDGVSDVLTDEELKNNIETALRANPDGSTVNQALIDKAISNGSRDNISSLWAPFRTAQELTTQSLLTGIFDGHGGNFVSNYLGEEGNFARIAQEECAKLTQTSPSKKTVRWADQGLITDQNLRDIFDIKPGSKESTKQKEYPILQNDEEHKDGIDALKNRAFVIKIQQDEVEWQGIFNVKIEGEHLKIIAENHPDFKLSGVDFSQAKKTAIQELSKALKTKGINVLMVGSVTISIPKEAFFKNEFFKDLGIRTVHDFVTGLEGESLTQFADAAVGILSDITGYLEGKNRGINYNALPDVQNARKKGFQGG